MATNRFVVAGETYSQNIGDGVIAESLGALIQRSSPDSRVDFLDISGRRPSTSTGNRRANPLTKNLLRSKEIRAARNMLKWQQVKSRNLADWQATIEDASCIIIGGGELLMDNSLSFPLRVHTVATIAREHGVDVHFVACGVGARWGSWAKRLFSSSLREASSISVRDSISYERLCTRLPNIAVDLSSDPALWSSICYDARRLNWREGPVGLGIMDLDSLNLFAHQQQKLTRTALLSFWLQIIRQLSEQNLPFELFTNGDPSDDGFAQEIANEASRSLSIECPKSDRPTRPSDLAANIGRYRAIIASRLHASIVATAYLTPAVGLSWGDKVKAFFDDTRRAHLVFDIFQTNTQDVMDALHAAMAEDVDPTVVSDMQNRIQDNINNIVSSY